MPREFLIGPDRVDDDSDCYVIAEIGHNHQGDLEQCKELFRVAKECGANAVKLQKRDNRALFTQEMYDQPYEHRNSYGPTYGEHRNFLEFSKEEHLALKGHADMLGVTFFSTAFDIPSADFLADLDMPAYKIASGDLITTPLLKHVAQFGKPMIVSTGGGTLDDVQRAYDTIMPINPNLCIMQCTSGYPAEYDELNLRAIETYRDCYPDVVIGYSGHDSGIAMAVVAYVLGARVVEKHFTLNRTLKGTDHAFSLEPGGLRRVVRDLKRTRIAMGDGAKSAYDSEKVHLHKMGKKLVAVRELPAGHVLSPDDLTFKSPGDGIPPYELDNLVGKTIRRALKRDEALSLSDLDAD